MDSIKTTALIPEILELLFIIIIYNLSSRFSHFLRTR
jgi:hypothetical protein